MSEAHTSKCIAEKFAASQLSPGTATFSSGNTACHELPLVASFSYYTPGSLAVLFYRMVQL